MEELRLLSDDDYKDIKMAYIDLIPEQPLKDFVIASLNKYGNDDKYKVAITVADLLYQRYEYMGLINPKSKQDFVDISLAAALLFNLFYDEEDIRTLFNFRIYEKEIAEQTKLDEGTFRALTAYVESTPGRMHEIIQMAPPHDTPAETLADCIWYVTKYAPLVIY